MSIGKEVFCYGELCSAQRRSEIRQFPAAAFCFANEKAYVTPMALYDLASTEYTITKTDYNGDEMKIYFDLKVADNTPVSRVLTVDTSNGGMRFLSCE